MLASQPHLSCPHLPTMTTFCPHPMEERLESVGTISAYGEELGMSPGHLGQQGLPLGGNTPVLGKFQGCMELELHRDREDVTEVWGDCGQGWPQGQLGPWGGA